MIMDSGIHHMLLHISAFSALHYPPMAVAMMIILRAFFCFFFRLASTRSLTSRPTDDGAAQCCFLVYTQTYHYIIALAGK
jgi:hypothetical protein